MFSENSNRTPWVIGIFVLLLVIGNIIYLFIQHRAPVTKCNSLKEKYNEINNKISSSTATGPLNTFFILGAFNCCKIGNGYESTCALTCLLKQGVRCLHMDIFSIQNNPVVASSDIANYSVKDTFNSVLFSSVMSVISANAFSSTGAPNNLDPLILYFRFYSTNTDMYTNMLTILNQYSSLFLGPQYSYDNYGKNFSTTPLNELSGKIIVVVDSLNDHFTEVPNFSEYINILSNSINMRSFTYYDVANTPDLPELQAYLCDNMGLVIPDDTTGNPRSDVCREAGIHIVCLNFTVTDSYLQSCLGFFNDAGQGFVAKPECTQSITIPDPTPQTELVSYQTRQINTKNYSFSI